MGAGGGAWRASSDAGFGRGSWRALCVWRVGGELDAAGQQLVAVGFVAATGRLPSWEWKAVTKKPLVDRCRAFRGYGFGVPTSPHRAASCPRARPHIANPLPVINEVIRRSSGGQQGGPQPSTN